MDPLIQGEAYPPFQGGLPDYRVLSTQTTDLDSPIVTNVPDPAFDAL